MSNFGPDISTSKSALDKSIVKGVAKYGPYGAFGVPTWQATTVDDGRDRVGLQGRQDPDARATCSPRSARPTSPPRRAPWAWRSSSQADGDLKAQAGYLFKINAQGKYVEIGDK